MANTHNKIATVTVGSGGAANIEFTTIPQTYTDLKLVLSARDTNASTQTNTLLRVNGLTTSIYTHKRILGTGASVLTDSSTQGFMYWASTPAASATASVFGNIESYIPNYTDANNKILSVVSVVENNAASADLIFGAGKIATSAAITQITLTCSTLFAQYSTATLYGIKSS